MGEEPVYPHDPGPHCPDHGQDHGDSGAPHAAQSPREKVHDAAEEIGDCCDGQDFQTALHHLRVRGVYPKEAGTEHIGAHAQHQGRTCRQDHAVCQDPVHPLLLAHTVVLAGKAHTGLGHRVHRHIEKAQDIVGGRVACHGDGAERVDRGLEHGVGEIDDRALDARRYAHLEDPFQVDSSDPKL